MSQTGGCVYILTNKPNGVLYIGVTADLAFRLDRHERGGGSKFAHKYNCTRLLLVETYPTIEEAIVREKRMKVWKRDWKIELIEAANPDWLDLSGFTH